MMEQFSYRAQMKKWGGQGDTGFRFDLKAENALLPIEVARVSFLPTDAEFSVEDDLKGLIYVTLPEGNYSFTLVAPGYEEMAHTGVMHRVNLILKKAVMSAMPEKNQKEG